MLHAVSLYVKSYLWHDSQVVSRAKAIKELMLDGARLRAERQSNASKRKSYQGFTPDQLASCKPFHDDQDIPTPTSAPGGLRRTVSTFSLPSSYGLSGQKLPCLYYETIRHQTETEIG